MKYNMVFVLGYDLLQKELAEQNLPCDIAFEVCRGIYRKFLVSKIARLDISEYDALSIYIDNNRKEIDNIIKEHGKIWS